MTSAHSVTHLRKSYTRGASGGRVLTATTVGTKNCRIMPLKAEEQTRLKEDGMMVDVVLYFSSDPSVLENDEFTYGGDRYQVKGVIDFDELGRLWKVYAIRNSEES